MIRDALRSRAAVALVALLCVAPAAGFALQADAPAEETEPGAQLAGVIGVGSAEVDAAVESRAFTRAVAAAETNESRAAVVADRVEQLRTRLETLQERREALRAALENGSMSAGEYRARVSALAARIATVESQLARSRSVAAALPERARAAAGLNVSAIERLRSEADALRGGEVAEIARSIAGNDVGRGIPDDPGRGPPGEDADRGNGPPDDAGNGEQPDSNRGDGNESDDDRGNASDGDRGNGSDRGNDGSSGGGGT